MTLGTSTLPPALHGPDFGSYAPDEVSWLLTDLSGHDLEAPVERRESAIQAGLAHYAESLPIEYQPDEEYQALYARALDDAAARTAQAVGVVTELGGFIAATLLANMFTAPIIVWAAYVFGHIAEDRYQHRKHRHPA